MSLTFESDLSQQLESENPYLRTPEELRMLTAEMMKDGETWYMHRFTNPELGDMSVHILRGDDPRSDVARAVEAGVSEQMGLYKSVDDMQRELASTEDNSIFFVLVNHRHTDTEDGEPYNRVIGALRVGVCKNPGDPSNTRETYDEMQPDADPEVRAAFDVRPGETELWDVVGVVLDKAYRGAKNDNSAAWMYHALYKQAVESGVPRWISSIHDVEYGRLGMVGVPFEQIPGTDKFSYTSVVNGREKVFHYGFYEADMNNVGASVEAKIAELEAVRDDPNQDQSFRKFCAHIAPLARIARFGSTDEKAHPVGGVVEPPQPPSEQNVQL